MLINNKHFMVIGTALSGIASTKFLLSRGAYVTLTDTKPKGSLDKQVVQLEKHKNLKGVYGKQPSLSLLDTIEYIIISPGVTMDIPIIKNAQKKNIEVLSEIELAFRVCKTPIIGITGTNGKTTTTSLVGDIFKENQRESYVVGNIGVPMISKIGEATKKGCFISEVSSFQLEGTKHFKPNISAILNITPDHLNRHKTMENYIAEKSKIFLNQSKGEITILNADDPITLSLKKKVKSKVVLFSRLSILEQGVFVEENKIYIKDEKERIEICSVSDIQILGDHNLENILAAIAIAYYGKIPIEVIKKVVQKFKGVSHRIEMVETICGIDFINDSKGTNPEASIKAIEAMKKPIILIAGGMDKGSDFYQFIKTFHGKVRYLILLGETTNIMEHSAIEQEFYNIIKVDNLEEAVIKSFEKAYRGDVVLLSPACASWDMFTNFEERGNVFKSMVKALRRSNDD